MDFLQNNVINEFVIISLKFYSDFPSWFGTHIRCIVFSYIIFAYIRLYLVPLYNKFAYIWYLCIINYMNTTGTFIVNETVIVTCLIYNSANG